MMKMSLEIDNKNYFDTQVDAEISDCFNQQPPKSFFLSAGAGSGKTRSLVQALQFIQTNYSNHLRLRRQRIGVITYTNDACDEIKRRINFDPLIEVSTIHSFVWTLVKGFNSDIKAWLELELEREITDLQRQQAKGRSGKASIDREKNIETKTKRLTALSEIKEFNYNPNGDNQGRGSLNHSEVIKIAANFLINKPVMQRLLITKFPILLIDESQDTNKRLMEALLSVQAQYSSEFMLGLFGDTMQKIYADGKDDLSKDIPSSWARPTKLMNHRCSKRVIELINRIRSDVDDQKQIPRLDAAEGFVRLFILDANITDKLAAEKMVAKEMATITHDIAWEKPEAIKTLILEHHMAAKRMDFYQMYAPLYRNDSLRLGLLDGTLSGLRLFLECVLPLVQAKERKDAFAVASIVRKHSPLLSKSALKAAGKTQLTQIQKTREAVEELWSLWEENKVPRFIDILRNVAKTGLFEIPQSLKPIAARNEEEQQTVEIEIVRRIAINPRNEETILDNWDEFLMSSFGQAKSYVDYVTDNTTFGTHQGVKGLEFQRVMLIIDDTDARGFSFSYDKLFEVKKKTKNDLDNEKIGKETGTDRTRRLFYVTCSRAKESLAIVAYSNDPQAVKENVIQKGWFARNEVRVI